jgi:hypothetical protein
MAVQKRTVEEMSNGCNATVVFIDSCAEINGILEDFLFVCKNCS